MELQGLRVIVSGRVQGVCFRMATQMTANRLGVRGFVRNLPDGSVEAVVVGDEEPVNVLLGWMHSGPTFAKVSSVDVEEVTITEEFSRFTIR